MNGQPLRTMFLLSSMPVGGQEILLVDLVKGFDRTRIVPEICCLKQRGELGQALSAELPIHDRLIGHKLDLGVLPRLVKIFRQRAINAVVTVGCGDKMFWGRLAAWQARIPVIVSALHSTGWPDSVGWLNRRLTFLTDAFIGVANSHGNYLVGREGFPHKKVAVIPNGIDTGRFLPNPSARAALRQQLNIAPAAPVCVIVAALRPEKNHRRFLHVAAQVHTQRPDARFLIVGDGPEREELQDLAHDLAIVDGTHFLGTRPDVAEILTAADAFVLTSDNEACPVSILEAMACELPVVSSRVGSISDLVTDGESGYLVDPSRESEFVNRILRLMDDPLRARSMGRAGRRRVCQDGSKDAMVLGYTELLETIFARKSALCDRQQSLAATA